MKRSGRAVLVITLVALGLVGVVAASRAQTKGGALRIAVPTMPTGYVITLSGGLADVLYEKLLQNALVRYDPKTLQPVPNLAVEWKAEDGARAWVFKLRQGVKWHDGRDFTADDVKFTFDTIFSKDVRARVKGNMGPLERVDVVDRNTVRFVFKEPFASFPAMTGYNAGIVPRHALAGQDLNAPAEFLKKPIGTGPFRFKEAAAGSHVVLEANPDYWEGRPALDQVVLKVVADFNAQIAQLKAGELDLALVQPRNMAALADDPLVRVVSAKQVNYFYVTLNHKDDLFTDVRVRRALNYAVDKTAIIKAVLRGQGDVATGPISPVLSWAYSADVTQYPFDVARAKGLLDEAGWRPGPDGIRQKDGKRFAFTMTTAKGVPDGEQLMTVVQQYLRAVGVDATLALAEFGQLWTGVFKGEYQSTAEYLVTPPDPDLFGQLACGAQLQRFFGYCNAALDRLLTQGRSTPDVKARAAAYARAQKELADNPPGIYLYYPLELRAVSKRLRGVPELPVREALQYASGFSLDR